MDNVIAIVRGVPYGLSKGVHYWEPTLLNNTNLGSDCMMLSSSQLILVHIQRQWATQGIQ